MPNLYVIAAMCGNFWWESTLNPGIYEGLKVVPLTDNSVYGGYGLVQWTNSPKHGVTRRTQLVEWLRANGFSDDSGTGQLQFLLHENTWYRKGYGANFGSLTDFLTSDSTDLTLLTYAWMQGWEGIWDGTQNKRLQSAYDCYRYIEQHYADDPGEWIAKNNYLSNAERYHNALVLYNFFTGGIIPPDPPDPPVPPDPPGPTPMVKDKMPLWMKIRYHL